MILHGTHLIKAWTRQQSVVATSTAEAELCAGSRAAAESMGVQAFAKDLGRDVPIRLHIDSSTALSLTSRTGWAKRNTPRFTFVDPRGGAQQEAHSGEDRYRDELFGPGNKARVERERFEMWMMLVNCFCV